MSRMVVTMEDAAMEYADLVSQSPDAVIFADREGAIRVWNAAAERIFGHTAEAAIGQTLDLIVPERFREAHWTGFNRALEDGVTKYVRQSLATRSMRADGTAIYIELSFAIVLDAAGVATGALATARDITERFESDRTQRRHVEELETLVERLRHGG
jgi:PAS domain S-box-containing protein